MGAIRELPYPAQVPGPGFPFGANEMLLDAGCPLPLASLLAKLEGLNEGLSVEYLEELCAKLGGQSHGFQVQIVHLLRPAKKAGAKLEVGVVGCLHFHDLGDQPLGLIGMPTLTGLPEVLQVCSTCLCVSCAGVMGPGPGGRACRQHTCPYAHAVFWRRVPRPVELSSARQPDYL